MAKPWWPLRLFGKDSSESSSHKNFLHLSRSNIERISELTSFTEPLNPHQCRTMSSKLGRTMRSIERIVESVDDISLPLGSAALENFYRVSEKGRQLVENCCNAEWWQASAFQIQNEETFKEILLEAGLSYNTIFNVVEDVNKRKKGLLCEDLRETATFDPPGADEVFKDRVALQERLNGLLNDANVSIRFKWLGFYLLGRVNYALQHPSYEDCDVRSFNQWPNGEGPDGEWGASEFLGGNVCKTTWLDVPCAKKIFEDEAQEEQWLAEAKILASLNHPNIVKFLCCNKYRTPHCTGHFIAMEQMETSLATFIKRLKEEGAKPSLFLALDVILQIAYGLCYLHEHGIAHRDLKTSNVVVREVGGRHLQYNLQVKLADFGISKVKLKVGRSNTITNPKTGTTVYMPPEAFTNGRADWFKADVYSFSVMCSVILSCHEPFRLVKKSDLYGEICSGRRPELPGDTPKELASLIMEGWATDRNLRPSFLDICSRLEKLRHGLLRNHGTSSPVGQEDSSRSNSYIDRMLKKRSETRERDCSRARLQTLINRTDQEEWFDGDEEQTTLLQQRHGASAASGAEEYTRNVTEWSHSGGHRLTDHFIITPHHDPSEVPVLGGLPNSNCPPLLSTSLIEARTAPVGRNHGPRVGNVADVGSSKGAAGLNGRHPQAGNLEAHFMHRVINLLLKMAKAYYCREEKQRRASQLLQYLAQLGTTEVGTQNQNTVVSNLLDAMDPVMIEALMDGYRITSIKDQSETLLLRRLHQLVDGSAENWTYGIFWQSSVLPSDIFLHSDICLPSEYSILRWGDGYFRGPRDSDFIEPKRTETAENQLYVKKVLRELQAIVCPDEDAIEEVSDAEWFYLVSMAHSFPYGVGIPGQALKSGHHVWLEQADKASNQVCTRADLAKKARIQTILCVPVMGGVVELGSTDLIRERREVVYRIVRVSEVSIWHSKVI